MKRYAAFIIIIIFLFNPLTALAEPAVNTHNNDEIIIDIEERLDSKLPVPKPTAEGAVLIEQNTGKVLTGKNEHKKLYPASTTKILTALIAIEMGDMDEIVTVGEEILMIASDSSLAGLYVGEKISLGHLLYGLMINSGNDAGNTIAVHIARTVSNREMTTQEALDYFSTLMNKRAREAGAKNSNFVTPHGYHHPDHYTTAYDLAIIAREAMEYELFRDAVSTTFMETVYWHNKEPRYWNSKNKLINESSSEYYPYATGIKTGWTTPAGSCLVSSASRDGLDLISVVLNSERNMQWSDTTSLFDYGFSNFKYMQLIESGQIVDTLPLENHSSDDWGSLSIQADCEDFSTVIDVKDLDSIRQNIILDEDLVAAKRHEADSTPRLLAPITRGQVVGSLEISLRGQTIVEVPLTAVRDVEKKTIMESIIPDKNDTGSIIYILLSAIAILVILRFGTLAIKRRIRRSHSYRW